MLISLHLDKNSKLVPQSDIIKHPNQSLHMSILLMSGYFPGRNGAYKQNTLR